MDQQAPLAQPPQAPQTTPLAAAPQPTMGVPPKKSRTGLMIGLIVGGVLLLGLIIFGVILLLNVQKGVVARARTNQVILTFFDSAKKKLPEKVYPLMIENTDESRIFVASAIAKVETDCAYNQDSYQASLVGGKQVVKAQGVCPGSGGIWYFTLTEGSGKQLYLSNISYKPNSSTSQQDTSKSTASIPDSTCPTAADLNALAETDDYKGPYFYQSFYFSFAADSSTNITTDSGYAEAQYAKAAQIYKAYPNKKYTIKIVPSVNESSTSSEGETLAAARAVTIKTELMRRGVASSKIVVEKSERFVDETASKNVTIVIEPDADCE